MTAVVKRCVILFSVAVILAAYQEASATTIVLEAEKHDGRDAVWRKRHSVGTASWGIRGSGEVEGGSMWFNSFPGPSGRYEVKFGVILERDGQPEYEILVDGEVLKSGIYPLVCEQLDCSKNKKRCPDKAVYLSLGDYQIQEGSHIEVKGKSTYPCGRKHGAYCRWFELKFERIPNQ